MRVCSVEGCGAKHRALGFCTFHYHANRRDRKRQYDVGYYRGNRAKIIARAIEWRKDRRRDFAMKVNQKAARYGVPGKLDWRDLVPDDCAYCGTPCESWDHVIPMSRGGDNTLDNLVPCCWPCNQDKGNRTPEEWLAGVPVIRPKRPYRPWSEARRRAHSGSTPD